MALTYGFYNSVEGDRTYDAIQFGRIFDGIIKDGVYATYQKGMMVKASNNASEVIIQPGRAWFNHTWSYNDADFIMEAPAPETLLDRIDALVLDINEELAVRANSYVWVQGTPSSRPERPTLENTTTHHQYPLCYVRRYPETTMIYAKDITNAVGTSECPFATGVLEGIDLDAWINQWDNEFHSWENATKTSFEAWMLTQQEVYSAWFESIRSQMDSDLAEFEAWFETIQGIIDEEAATHLQSEIDEIKAMLPSGSHITIVTTNTELFGRNVTVSDRESHSATAKFDNNGIAVIETFPYVGVLTVTSTDGIRTATTTLTTPYFGRYSCTLSFWAATVNIIGDSGLGGDTVTIKNSSEATVGAVVLDGEGKAVWTATEPDTYTFSVTHGGETMSVTLEVTQETTYNVEIHGGFNWQRWVDLSENYDSSDFDDLDELLADQKAVRELMTIHACVDYMADATRADANITKIINNDICAKWINDRDYALDTLHANSAIAAVMDEADKYFYGEWCLMPQVPKMTSNTAPSGEVFYTSQADGSEAYKAFDGNTSTRWLSSSAIIDGVIGYHFQSEVCIKRAKCRFEYGDKQVSLAYSDDGINYTIASETISITNGNTEYYIDTNETTAHSYWRLNIHSTSSASNMYLQILQFYAYAPKGCVPVMTSNTAPYGTAFASTQYDANYAAWKAFSTVGSNTYWSTSQNAITYQHIGYQFVNPICVKKVVLTNSFSNDCPKNCVIQYSNDGTNYTNAKTFVNKKELNVTVDLKDNNIYATYWRLVCIDNYGSSYIYLFDLQFYGRQLSVSVPKMTSNTAPYGEASASSYRTNNEPYKAFDGVMANAGWQTQVDATPNDYIRYKFKNKIMPKKAIVIFQYYTSSDPRLRKFKIQGSNDGTNWDDVSDVITAPTASSTTMFTIEVDLTATTDYQYLQLKNMEALSNTVYLFELQFYGLDYSEKEFEPGTTKKWLYDHGVEVAAINVLASGTGAVATKNSDYVEISTTSATNSIAAMYKQENLSDYNTARCKFGDTFNPTSGYIVLAIYSQVPNASGNGEESILNMSSAYADLPYAVGLNISSFTGNHYVSIHARNGSTGYVKDAKITELWLEE